MSIRAFVAEILIKIFSVFPIEKKAVFSSYYGKYNNDSPMALYEEIRRILPYYKFIWLMQDNDVQIEGAEVVKTGSAKSVYHLATSVLWVDNCNKPIWIKIKKQKL